jgi:hypothetical protein
MIKVEKKRMLKSVTITHVSYVKKGQNKKQFFFAKSITDQANVEFPVKFIAKSQEDNETEEQKLLYGIVYEPDTEDYSGDFMTREEIEKSAHEFLQHYRNIDTEHDLMAGAGIVVESYVAPVDFKIGDTVIKAGSWVLGTKASDEIWDAWKNNEITGYSMFGISRETQLSKGEPIMKSWTKKFLEAVGLSKSFDEAMEEKLNMYSSSPHFILDVMREDFYQNISWDALKEEELTALSNSMKSAAAYVDKKISEISNVQNVAKSTTPEAASTESPEQNSDEKPAAEIPAIENEAIPNVPEAENEENAAVPAIPEIPEIPENNEETPEAENTSVEAIAKSVSNVFLQAIAEMESRFEGRFAELNKSILETNEKINEKATQSAVIVPGEVTVAKSTMRGKGLI